MTMTLTLQRRGRAGVRPGLRHATADLDPPFGVLDTDAVATNLADLRRRAAGKPIRVATKSIRMRDVLAMALAEPGFAGLLAYTLPEAIWLCRHGFRDIVVGYPSVDRAALRTLAADETLRDQITVMVDDVRQLDLVDAACPPARRGEIRVCLELDASYRPIGPALTIGALRSPVRSAEAAAAMAAAVARRPGFRLVGLMAYEGQIAGVGNRGRLPRAAVVRAMQARSAAELADRRGAAVDAVRRVADLEFVNGGGTGSIESTGADQSVTEIAAGSGILGPALFDRYVSFRPAPAAFFVLSVVRRPSRSVATVAGGGWIASGPPGADRLPTPADPVGLRYVGMEGPGEVQTPLRGRAAAGLAIGDQVWFRHAKSGEIGEHLNELQMISGDVRTGTAKTYRGEGMAFL